MRCCVCGLEIVVDVDEYSSKRSRRIRELRAYLNHLIEAHPWASDEIHRVERELEALVEEMYESVMASL